MFFLTEHSNYMFYIYVIRNRLNKSIYTGYTNNLKRRLEEHNEKKPELIYYEAYKSKKDVHERERKLKQRGQSVRWLKSRLKYTLH